MLDPTVVRVEFRDGERDIPFYLFKLMSGIDTYAVSYADAVAMVNTKVASDHANNVMKKVITEHFRMHR